MYFSEAFSFIVQKEIAFLYSSSLLLLLLQDKTNPFIAKSTIGNTKKLPIVNWQIWQMHLRVKKVNKCTFIALQVFSFFWDVSQIQQLHSLNEIDRIVFLRCTFIKSSKDLKVFALKCNLQISVPNLVLMMMQQLKYS